MAQDLEEKLERFNKVDSHMYKFMNKFAMAQVDMLSETPRFGPWYKYCIFITGSQIEGGFYAKMFLDGKHINEGDYMFSVGDIEDPKHQLQPYEHAPGYFSVKYNGILECFHDGVREKFLESSLAEQESNNNFLTGSSVMDMTENMFTSTARKTRANELIGDILFQPQQPCKAEASYFQRKGPSVKIDVILMSAGVHLVETQVDTVACFKLSSWPDDFGFEEFLNRKRKWPSNSEDVKSIQDKVHIVPKSSPNLKEENESKYCWRLSFSKAETHLMSLFSDEEKRVYLLFKILFYTHIKKIKQNEKTMASYFCKTTMLWIMEEQGLELCKNIGDSLYLLEAIQMLFGKFKQFLDNGFIPNFFYPSNNLIEGYPQDLITECSIMAGNINQRPLEYVPDIFNECCEHLEELVERIDQLQIEDFLDTLLEYVKENRHLIGSTLIELFWHLIKPRNWPGRLFFHPLVRALIRAWARRRLIAVRNVFSRCVNCCS